MVRIALVVALSALGAAVPASAQTGPALQPGEIIENGGGQQLKVLRCKPTAYRWRECETVLWVDGRADSNPAWWNEGELIKGDAVVRDRLGMPPRGGVPAAATRPATRVALQSRTVAPATRPAAGGKRIPDGTYKCMTWIGSSYVSMGVLRSANNSLDTGFLAKVGATFTGATPTAGGVTINYTSRSGYRESMDCTRQ